MYFKYMYIYFIYIYILNIYTYIAVDRWSKSFEINVSRIDDIFWDTQKNRKTNIK